jgi:hypothetical protein
MMKNNQTLYAAGLLGVLALLYYFTQTGGVDTKSMDSDLFKFNREAISVVELKTTNETLVFTHDAAGWTLADYPVDTVRMARFLDQFTDLIPDRMITKNTAKHAKFDVTAESARFIARNSESKELLNLIIGQQGANYQETFVRQYSSDEVYAVKASLTQYKNKTPKDFWDRRLADIKVDQIEKVVFSGEISYALERNGVAWTYDSEQVDFEKVTDMLAPLGNMKASNFADQIDDSNELYQSINLAFIDGSKLDLTFYLKDENSSLLLVKVSNNDKIFEYSKSGLNRYQKKFEDLAEDSQPDA